MSGFHRAVWMAIWISGAMSAAEPVRDEAVRLNALRAIFPGATRIFDSNRKVDLTLNPRNELSPFRLDDSLREESVYVVSGAIEPHETCAAAQAGKARRQAVRRLRYRLFQLGPTRYLVALNYHFADATPPRECYRIGRVVLLDHEGGNWKQLDVRAVTKPGFRMFSRLQLEDLNGDGHQELLLDWNWSGENAAGTELEIFNLREGRILMRFSTFSQTFLYGEEGEEIMQLFDLKKTLADKGRRAFFRRVTFVRKSERLAEPEMKEISMPLPPL